MAVISMKKLLEVGVHFGHQTKRWNPKMAPYIFTARNGIYIIDLKKSSDKIDEAYAALMDIVAKGGKVLFVGTKKQAQEEVLAYLGCWVWLTLAIRFCPVLRSVTYC